MSSAYRPVMELGQRSPIQVFLCTKGQYEKTTFVTFQTRVVKAAPALALTPHMHRHDAIRWLESRGWKVERLDVG